MSMYRSMQNSDTPNLPFAQSTMELATLQRSSGTFADLRNPDGTWKSGCCPTCLCAASVFKPDMVKSPLYHKVQKTRSVDIFQLEKQRNTGLLALAGVLLLA